MPPADPCPAASLVLLRRGDLGPEVLLGRRARAARAFPGALVFPGGKLEPGDASVEAAGGLASGLAPARPGAAHAALREMFEEAGLWLCAPGAALPYPRAPGFARLTPYAHWITPESFAHRFDTWFFLAVATATEASARPRGDELETLAWMRPGDVLAREGGTLFPPTRHTLARLDAQGPLDAILTEAQANGPFDATRSGSRWRAGGP